MLLSRKTTVRISESYSLIISRMGLASYKLWNILNYERIHYKELNLPVEYPDWYYQKKVHKDNPWSRQLSSSSAQELCKLLDKSWKAFYVSRKADGGERQKPPKYKYDPWLCRIFHAVFLMLQVQTPSGFLFRKSSRNIWLRIMTYMRTFSIFRTASSLRLEK